MKMVTRLLLPALLLAMPAQAQSSDSVLLYAAGSLRGALSEIAKVFEQRSGVRVEMKYGASGLLKDEIAGGARAEVFASANMEHPQALMHAGMSGPVVLFARNRMCALVREGIAADPATLLERMLDPGIKLGTSTPKADPSGDYAWEIFKKAEALKAGSFVVLENKALQLIGGPSSAPPPPGLSAYGALLAAGKADVFLTYCTNAVVATKENASQRIVELPADLVVGADYGLTVIATAPPAAYRFAMFIMSDDGQRILARHGFSAPGFHGSAISDR
jgi:ABC-type molybdate transport system substrate-binding protein